MFLFLLSDTADKNQRIEELIALTADGDTSAFGELYSLTKTGVYAFCLTRLKNRFEAEDVTQETFVKIYRYADRYTPKGKPMAWIITIASNLVKRRFTILKRTVELDESLVDEASLEDKIVDSEFLKTMLASLRDDEREIVILHAVTGLKHREIAKMLDLPLSTVLSRYNRAIKKLQKAFKEDCR